MSFRMTDDISFTYDQYTRTLKIKDGDEIKVWKLNDDKSEIFYYILKAIDLLDNEGTPGSAAPWAQVGNEDLIPMEKLDTGNEPGQIATIGEEGTVPIDEVFEGATEVEDPTGTGSKYTFIGGNA